MVQAIAPILATAGTMIGAGTSALANQPRREIPRPPMPSVALAMAGAPDKKTMKALAKASREDRLVWLLTQPEIIGLLTVLVGIYASQNIPFSDNEVTNEGLQAISTTASVLVGLGYAGVGDLTTLLVAGMAGGISLVDMLGLPDMPNIDIYGFLRDINPANILGALFK